MNSYVDGLHKENLQLGEENRMLRSLLIYAIEKLGGKMEIPEEDLYDDSSDKYIKTYINDADYSRVVEVKYGH